jgi:Uma2 family endonuclease
MSSLPARKPVSLENGDRMRQPEFHRRYLAAPKNLKAELIGGTVYVASPLGRLHGQFHSQLSGPFWIYQCSTPGIEVLDNATTILGESSEPQPDLALRILSEFGGRSQETDDQFIEGPPELIAEIAHSSVSLDLHDKREDYQAAGVLEYIVLCVEPLQLHWFNLRTGRMLKPDRGGIYRSRVFPGLWINSIALLERNSRKVLDTVQEGLASPEHAALVRKLAKRKK